VVQKLHQVSLHAFRHGRVSFLVENNVPTNVIKQWIGHGSQKMIDLYTHSRPEFHQKVLATLPPILLTIPSPQIDPRLTLDSKTVAA
jgi:integrase